MGVLLVVTSGTPKAITVRASGSRARTSSRSARRSAIHCMSAAKPSRSQSSSGPGSMGSARELAALTLERYEAVVPGTALARAGFHGLRRNAALALGAQRDAGARPILLSLAGDPAPLVAAAAQWAIAELDRT